MNSEKIKVLYIDDELHNLQSFKAVFRVNYEVLTAISGAAALEVLNEEYVHIIVTDQRMPGMTGVEFLETILESHPDPVRILLTGYTDINAVIDAVNKGKIFHYLNKPWNEEELDQTMQTAFELYQSRIALKEANLQLMTSNDQLEFLLRQKLLS